MIGGTHDQSSSGSVRDATTTSWTPFAGYERMSLRDLARTTLPVDGSPVILEGRGAGFGVEHERRRPSASHLLSIQAVFTHALTLAAPVGRRQPRPGDSVIRAAARYRYTRYPLSNVTVRGLAVGFGVDGGAALRRDSRHWPPADSWSNHESELAAGGLLAARFERSRRFTLDASWAAGLAIARAMQRHASGSGVEHAYWGGGWQTELAVRARVSLTDRVSILSAAHSAQEWRLLTHRKYTDRLAGVRFGIVYAR
jgi:hypothetical protein